VVDGVTTTESEIGHFTNAIKPDVDTFREFTYYRRPTHAAHKEDKNC
jgi:UPF0176 protein